MKKPLSKQINLGCIFYNIDHPFELGENGTFKGILHFQLIVSNSDEGELQLDVEVMDITEMELLGKKINYDYNEWNDFKKSMLPVINLQGLLDKETEQFEAQLKNNKAVIKKLTDHLKFINRR